MMKPLHAHNYVADYHILSALVAGFGTDYQGIRVSYIILFARARYNLYIHTLRQWYAPCVTMHCRYM